MDSINSRFSGLNGAYACSGNIDNPMFQNIRTGDGFYIPCSARKSRRYIERLNRKNRKKISTKRITISSPNRGLKK